MCSVGRQSSSDGLGWLPAGLTPAVFRLARVDQLADELGALAAEWSKNEPIALGQRELPSGEWQSYVTGVRPVPPLAALLFSEAVHHLRSAVENALLFLVEEERGVPLDESAANKVAMPVCKDEREFERWQDRVGGKVPELGSGSKLGDRVKSLQPYVDTLSRLPSMPRVLGELWGEPVVYDHPLVLLQRYSNLDKHRRLRFCASRTLVSQSDVPSSERAQGWQELTPGTVIATTKPGRSIATDFNSALLMERPDSGVFVGPVVELTGLHSYVAEVVMPILVKNLAKIGRPPTEVDLGDTGETDGERLARAGKRYSFERWQDGIDERMTEMEMRFPRILPPPSG